MYLFILIVHIFLLIGSIVFIGVVLTEKANDTTKYLFTATVCNFLAILGYMQELLGIDKSQTLFSIKIQLLGMTFIISFMIFFATRIRNYITPAPVRIMIVVVDMFFLVVILTAEYHNLFFKSIEFVQTGYYPHIVVTEGIVCKICQIYNVALGIWFSLITVKDIKNKKRTSPIFLLPLCFLPTVISVIFFYVLTPEKMGFNPVPGSIGVGMSYLIFMVYKYRLLDTKQLARDSIVESLNEIYLVTDVSKRLLFASTKAYSVFPGLRSPETAEELIRNIYDNNRKNMEITGRQYQVSVSAIYDKTTLKGYSLWLFDKTEEYENTKRLIELKNKAVEASYAKTLFLANMSHEIRTPLNAIMGTTEMIIRSNPKPEVLSMANDIKGAGNQLSSVISGILDFSKIESGEFESVEVNYDTASCIRETIKAVAPRIRNKGIEFKTNISENIPKGLRGDVTHVKQILINILDNACKYTEEGHIILSIEPKEIEGNNSEILIYFTVEDTGCGIKEKAIPNIFDSFQRLELRKHADIQGTGLGLAISKRLVESMGGKISVESVYGEGSKFMFFVKQRIWDPVPMGRFEIQKTERGKGKPGKSFVAPDARILCVDDNLTNRKVIKELLSIYRIRADVAASGSECLEKLRQGNTYHMIFMDYMMPEMDGIQTTKKMYKSIPGTGKIPVIALTADAVVGAKELFLDNGLKDYLSKPVELPDLEKVLLTYLPGDIIRYPEEEEETKPETEIIIPGVDVKAALPRYGGDCNRYLKALSFLDEDGEKQLSRMKQMLLKNDYEGFGCEAHAVKGLALGIGADGVSELAKKEEFSVKEGRTEEVKENAEEFFNSYELLLANIRLVLKEMNYGKYTEERRSLSENGDSADNSDEEKLTEEEFQVALNIIMDVLDLLDESSAEKNIRKLLKSKPDKKREAVLKGALEDVREFEYADARIKIEGLLKQ